MLQDDSLSLVYVYVTEPAFILRVVSAVYRYDE